MKDPTAAPTSNISASLSVLRWAPQRGGLRAIAIAAFLLGFGFLVRIPLDWLARSPLPPYLTIYPLLPFIGFLSGFRIALAAIFGAVLIAWYFLLEPLGNFAIPDMRTALTIGIFATAGPIAAAAGALARHALEHVAALHAAADLNAREAVHRTKNILAAVQVVVRGEDRRTTDRREFIARLEDTLMAMGRAQDVLVGNADRPPTLASLVQAGVAVCACQPQLRLAGGEDCALPDGDFSGLVLALHELCTNSLKYGALGSDGGSVELSWCASERCILSWEEAAPVARGAADGFGSKLIRGALARVAGGDVDYCRGENGLRCVFSWPAPVRQRPSKLA